MTFLEIYNLKYNFYQKLIYNNTLASSIFMPRSSRGGFSRGRSASPMPTRSSIAATRPMPATQTPLQTQTQQRGGILSGIGSTIAQGMAFGAGSEVAHQAVRSLMGGSSHAQSHNQQEQVPQQTQQVQQTQQNPCQS